MNQHQGSPLIVVVGATEVFVEEGLCLRNGSGQGVPIQSIFEDGLDASIALAADNQSPVAGGLQAVFSIRLSQTHDPETTAKSLLGMGSGYKDGLDQPGCG